MKNGVFPCGKAGLAILGSVLIPCVYDVNLSKDVPDEIFGVFYERLSTHGSYRPSVP